jgi:hypothetical protein
MAEISLDHLKPEFASQILQAHPLLAYSEWKCGMPTALLEVSYARYQSTLEVTRFELNVLAFVSRYRKFRVRNFAGAPLDASH